MSDSYRDIRNRGKPRLHYLALVAVLLAGTLLAACGDPTREARDLERKGDLNGAAALYREALQRDPGNVEILAALAADLMLLGKFAEALPVQERVVALDSRDVQTRVELGFNYLNHQDRATDAVRVFTEATAINPTAQHLTFLAQAQIVSGEAAGAEQSLRRALEADPRYGYSYIVLERLLTSQGREQEAAAVGQLALQNGVKLETVP
jgi:tetratricopeptide (TPR) repeat protein